jgi:hypothetical protein
MWLPMLVCEFGERSIVQDAAMLRMCISLYLLYLLIVVMMLSYM